MRRTVCYMMLDGNRQGGASFVLRECGGQDGAPPGYAGLSSALSYWFNPYLLLYTDPGGGQR